MSKAGPIVIIDDDPDDQEMIQRVITKMGLENEIRRFYDGEEALHYFQNSHEQPFLILCDINMPLMNGLQLKASLEATESLKGKSIPFVYLTTTANAEQVDEAYALTVQGFFLKGQSYDDLKRVLHCIVSYWKTSCHPNN